MAGDGTWVTELFTTMTFGDWLTTSLAAYAGVKVFQGRPQRIVATSRRRFLGALPLSREQIRERTRVVLGTREDSPASELSWLADCLGVQNGVGLEFAPAHRLEAIAAAYDAYATRIEHGVLFGATAAPIVTREVDLCHAVSRRLRAAAARDGRPGKDVVALTVAHRGLELELFGLEETTSGSPVAPDFAARDLDISYRRHRVEVPALPGERKALPPPPKGGAGPRTKALPGVSPGEVDRVREELRKEHIFDGIIPRLTDWRVERDPRSGRQSMHLSLAECTYGTVVLDHYPQSLTSGPGPRPVTGSRVGLLTLSAVVLTACDHLVFVRRSEFSHSHARQFGPAINGNLEFFDRRGLSRDLDADGLPAPLAALAREGREELGLDLTPGQISLTAVGRFTVPSEVGTHLLSGLAVLDLDLRGLLLAIRHADPVEGSWELGGSLLAVPFPRTESSIDETISWITGSPELTPHATLSGLGAIAVHGNLRQVFARAATSRGSQEPVPRPDWVREVPLAEPQSVRASEATKSSLSSTGDGITNG